MTKDYGGGSEVYMCPEYQEEDWEKMQQYLIRHTTPSVWQLPERWVSYALPVVAAIIAVSIIPIQQIDPFL